MPDVKARSFRQSLLAVLGICFVVVMVAIDQTVVGTAMPTIVAELRGFELYAWVATGYFLMSIVTVPLFGRLGDYYGRKPFVIASIVIFTLASVLCGLASSMLFLIAARAFQGIGGGMLIGTAFACVPDLFPEAHVRLRWQIWLSSSFGIANAIGPSLGGVLTHAYGWRSVFYVNVPVGVVGLWFVVRYLPHLRHDQKVSARLDVPGAMLIIAALASFQLFVQWLPKEGLTPGMWLLLALCAGSCAALLWWERRCAHPILPFDMFRDRRLSPLFMLATLTGVAMFTLLFYAPLMLQGGFGLTPRDAGLLITPLVVCITFGSIVNGRVIMRMRAPNVMLYVGFGLFALSFVGIVLMHRTTPLWAIALFMLIGGFGLGFIMPNLTVFAQDAADRTRLGIVTALLQSLRMIGGMLGTAVVGTLVNSVYLHGVHEALIGVESARWEHALQDPQVLVNPSAHAAFLSQATAAGLDAPALVEAARVSLVSAVRAGQMIGLVVILFALWRVRAVPRVTFKRRAELQPVTREGKP